MSANDQIAEPNRQRAEKRRLIDEEYDQRVRMVMALCPHEFGKKIKIGSYMNIECAACGEDLVKLGGRALFGVKIVGDCGADMSAQST